MIGSEQLFSGDVCGRKDDFSVVHETSIILRTDLLVPIFYLVHNMDLVLCSKACCRSFSINHGFSHRK